MTTAKQGTSGKNPSPHKVVSIKNTLWLAGLLLILWGTFAWFFADRYFDGHATTLIQTESRRAEQQADIIAHNIDHDLDYLRGIPPLLAAEEDVQTALLKFGAEASASPLPVEQRKQRWTADATLNLLNRTLALTVRHLGTDMIWVMNTAGDCIASGNADKADSFVGTNYADRSYFVQASQGQPGRQYAMGRKSGIPGLFFSYPVIVEGRFIGAVAVKRELPNLAFWVEQADAFVADELGVIILARDQRLVMHALPGAAIARQSAAETILRYRQTSFPPLSLHSWGDPRYPVLKQLDDEPSPLLLASRKDAEAAIDIFVIRRLPTIVTFEQERYWLFLLLLLAGTLLIATVGGVVFYLRSSQRARQTLAEHKKRLDEAQRIARVGSWELDLATGALHWSDEIYRTFEIDPLHFEASYEAFLQLVHPEERERVDSAYRESVANHQPYEITHRLQFADGRIKHVQEHCETYYDVQGKALRSAGTVQDVSERVIAEAQALKAAQEIEDLYDHAPCGYHSLSQDGLIQRINHTELQWLGYRHDELVGKVHFIDLLTPASRETFYSNFPRFKQSGAVHDLEFDLVRKDGSTLTVLLNSTAIYDEAHHYLSSRSTLFDITERKAIERALSESEERFRDILEHAPIGMAVVSLEGHFLRLNRALCDIVGYSREELEQLTFHQITHPEDLDADLANVEKLLAGEINAYQMEKRYLRKGGQPVWVQLTGSLLRDASGAPLHFIAQIEDITERKANQERFRQLAYYDTLTGLPNRRLLMDRLALALTQARRYQRAVAVMFMDLDHFKQINDTWGHDVGDELLRVVASRLEHCVRSVDTVSRQGGDEFVLVLSEIAHPRDAALVAENILKALSEPITAHSQALQITTSIGIAIYPDHGSDGAEELMKKADTAMYAAKRGGRNGYLFYTDEA